MRWFRLVGVLGLTAAMASCGIGASPDADWPTNAWATSLPEAQGIDSSQLTALVDDLVALDVVDSISVVRNGFVVLDVTVYPTEPAAPHFLYSVTKSVIATLVGIAIDDGLLESVDVRLVDVLPVSAVPADVDALKSSITIRDALAMATGLDCRDSGVDGRQQLEEMIASDDWVAFVMALPMASEPGVEFGYCNGVTHVLSGVLTEVTGRTAADYADDVLFGPLGIFDYSWPTSPEGNTIGYDALTLRPLDVAKLGYLYLRRGEWDGTQIVASAWIADATTPQTTPAASIYPNGPTGAYGYQWWLPDENRYEARGLGGQRIFLLPESDVIAIVTSGAPPEMVADLESLILERLAAAVVSDDPLPENPTAAARLDESVASASSPPSPRRPSSSTRQPEVDGARYVFEPVDYGYQGLTIAFENPTVTIVHDYTPPPGFPTHQFDAESGPLTINAGLDGLYRTTDTWGSTIAARGGWIDNQSLIIQWQFLGTANRGYNRYSFADNELTFIETLNVYETSSISIGTRAN